MKYILQAFMVLLLLQSCQSDELKVSFKTIEINIPGTLGPSLKHKSKYYCYFEKDNPLGKYTIVNFYILDESGKVKATIPPPPIQFSDYNLTVRNDTIFTTNYKSYASFYLDEKKKKWIRDLSTSNIIFKDQNYTVFNRSLDDCCSKTWFKDNKTGQQYEVFTENAIVNKLNNVYYLSTPTMILKIQDPKKLEASGRFNADHHPTSKDDPQKGTEVLYQNKFSGMFMFQSSLATSFVVKQNLYHLYSEGGSTKIVVLKDDNLINIFDIKDDIRPYHPLYEKNVYSPYIGYQDEFGSYRSPYTKMNYVPGNEYQTLPFSTSDPNRSGIIEIDKNKLNIITLKNKYQEPILGEPYTKSWVEKNFMDFYTHFNTLSIQQIDRIEKKENALNLTQYSICDDCCSDCCSTSCDEIPRVYQKIERKYIHLITSYFYSPENQSLKLIEFQWKTQSRATIHNKDNFEAWQNLDTHKIFAPKFEWLHAFLKQKLGEPVSENPSKVIWETETQMVELSYNYDNYNPNRNANTKLTLYKKQKN
ncbi:hypothetical protein [Chryseobacterium jejuense]|uniref:hypothetical protein n=1 Tax=Chryseobacterium jejuense TaxID=445960 RepID=UPI001AE22FF3|nr:hypothetical protein [Chryseobacterium jejuense]MBP2616304.1 hypothetical protein [Chryseobacterium jejuense]